jgi:hypothetical protein
VRTGRQIHEIGTGAHVLADHGAATVLHLAGSNAEAVTRPSVDVVLAANRSARTRAPGPARAPLRLSPG